jgi:hypothetical protein
VFKFVAGFVVLQALVWSMQDRFDRLDGHVRCWNCLPSQTIFEVEPQVGRSLSREDDEGVAEMTHLVNDACYASCGGRGVLPSTRI